MAGAGGDDGGGGAADARRRRRTAAHAAACRGRHARGGPRAGGRPGPPKNRRARPRQAGPPALPPQVRDAVPEVHPPAARLPHTPHTPHRAGTHPPTHTPKQQHTRAGAPVRSRGAHRKKKKSTGRIGTETQTQLGATLQGGCARATLPREGGGAAGNTPRCAWPRAARASPAPPMTVRAAALPAGGHRQGIEPRATPVGRVVAGVGGEGGRSRTHRVSHPPPAAARGTRAGRLNGGGRPGEGALEHTAGTCRSAAGGCQRVGRGGTQPRRRRRGGRGRRAGGG